MTLDPNDARLTAYALGELDSREAALVEAELGQSPEAARAIVEIRRTAELIRAALHAEPAHAAAHAELSAAARAKIYAAADGANGQHAAPRPSPVAPRKRMSGWLRRHKVAVGLLAVAILATGMLFPATQRARESARVNSLALLEGVKTNAPDHLQDDVGYFPPGKEYSFSPKQAVTKDGKPGERELGYTVVKPQFADRPTVTPYLALPVGKTGGGESAKGSKDSYGLQNNILNGPAPISDSLSSSFSLDTPPVALQQDGTRQLVGGSGPYKLNKQLEDLNGRQNQAGESEGLYARNKSLYEKETAESRYVRSLNLTELKSTRGGSDGDVDHAGEGNQGTFEETMESLGKKQERLESANEDYAQIVENAFQAVGDQPLSTFSIDVDTASYSNVRRFLNQGSLPPPSAVRIEELINYFHYSYAPPKEDAADPFAAHADVVACPWAPNHRLVRIGIKGREIAVDKRPACNLVFLVDVSGSMNEPNKLPLVKEGLRMLVEKLGENDSVAIVVYAGASGLALPSTNGTQKRTILAAIDKLEPGGSTNGASGIQLAYETAIGGFIKGGANRVILATDGDFNVGITDQGQLVNLIEEKAKSGVFLSVLGFGMGNLKDSTLEKLSDKGNGNYAYIDSSAEARKVLVEQLSGTLVTIAKDVKIQIEFNPAKVLAYRLIGYENRMLAKEDFNDDKKDAGEIGAGHTVTALYEVVPVGVEVASVKSTDVDPLEYQDPPPAPPKPEEPKPAPGGKSKSSDLLMLKLRYKAPDGDTSKLLKYPVVDNTQSIGAAGDDCELAAAVAAFGMQLRRSSFKGTTNYGMILELAEGAVGEDKDGYRREFVELVKKAQAMGR